MQYDGHRLYISEACLTYRIPTKYLFLGLSTTAIYYQNRHEEQAQLGTKHGGSKGNVLSCIQEASASNLIFVTFLSSSRQMLGPYLNYTTPSF
jgi:hypothetical protein